jgi:hypothetical protein
MRITSRRERSKDFDAVRATTPIQTRIDTSLWTSKGKSAKDTWIQMLESMHMLVCLACHGGKI